MKGGDDMKNLEALENLLLETLGAETMLLNVIKALDVDTKADIYEYISSMFDLDV